MGPKAKFFPSFVGRTKTRDKVPIENCLTTGNKKAVDISGWIVAGLKGGDGSCARAMTSSPSYEPLDLLDSIDFKYDALVSKGLELVMYFDGARNPLKDFTNEERRAIADAAAKKLMRYIDWAHQYEDAKRDGSLSAEELKKLALKEKHLQTMARLRKIVATPDEGVYALVVDHLKKRHIQYRCAPFEADGQLAYDERMGYVSGLISEDGDIIGLGGSQLITQIDFVKGLAHIVDCKEWVNEQSTKHGGYYSYDDIPEIAAFCGCDFIRHLGGFGPVTVEEIWKQYASTPVDQRREFLENIEATAVLPPSAGGGRCEGWADRFEYTVSFYRYCPVFALVPKKEGTEVDFNDESTYRVVLAPLTPYVGRDGEQWGKMIGHGVDPASLLTLSDYNDGYHLRRWPRTGQALRRAKVPLYSDGVAINQPLPPFAELDFDAQPIHSLPNETLRLYLLCRGIFLSASDTREDVEDLVRKVSVAPTQVLPPCLKIRDEKYTGFEMIQLRQGGKQGAAAFGSDFVPSIRRLLRITEEEASRFIGRGIENSNNVRNRALDLLRGGFLDIETVSICKCASVVDSSQELLLVRCECLASQKDEHYTVYLCFEDKEDGHLMPNPYSSCHCPVGSFFCSHMISLYVLLAIVQRNAHLARDDFIKYMPEIVEHIHQLPMLVEQIAIYEQMLRTKPRGKRKRGDE